MVATATETVRRYIGAVERRDLEALDALVASDFTAAEPGRRIDGIDELHGTLEAWFSTFPEQSLATLDLFGDEDRVAWRWRLDGRHRESGREISVEGIIIFAVEDDRIASYWGQYDRLGFHE